VGGTVQLDWKESGRQSVRSPIPAIVESVQVKTGDTVKPGQVLAKLSSQELEREIAEVEEKLVRAHQDIEVAARSQVQAQSSVLEISARAEVAQMQAERWQQRAIALEQGTPPPAIQGLMVEQQRLQGQLQESATQVQRLETLYREGAIALTALEERQSQYRNIERDLAQKAEQIAAAKQQVKDTSADEIASANAQSASVVAAQQIAASTAQINAQQEAIATLSDRLEVLKQLRSKLELRATTGGTVITSDLDLLVGQELRPDTPLLQIANLRQLTANVQMSEEDLDYVEIGAPVTFRPRQAKLETYQARVEDVLYNVQADDTKQQRVATVRVVIENPNDRLRPGSSGYARIFSEWIPLYERVGRELLKLVPERFL
jgi:multidrug resistance efflux pump